MAERKFLRTFAEINVGSSMKSVWAQWKSMVTVLVGAGTFVTCLWPLRALMNYHEEHHLFRWTGYYVREQWSSWEGIGEFFVSFVTQFFYVGWLGALVVALTVMAGCWLLRLVTPRKGVWNMLWLVAVGCWLWLVAWCLVPERYRREAAFREAVELDYLVRTQQWDAIVNRSDSDSPLTDMAVWCTNYALAMRGQLSDFLFFYPQKGVEGLLTDGRQQEPLAYFTLSNIFLQLGMVNNAERMAFDAKQYVPHNHKSGRLYRRLAETNLMNGNTRIAAKYLHYLESTLFYGQWARNRLASRLSPPTSVSDLSPLSLTKVRVWRCELSHLLPPNKADLLLDVVRQHPKNLLAWDYLLAYELLLLDQDKVAEYMQQALAAGYGHVPRAVQECLVGSKMLNQELPTHVDFTPDEDVVLATKAFFHILNETKDPNNVQLSTPPLSQTYWYYRSQTIQHHFAP